MPRIFSAFFSRKPRLGVPSTEQAKLTKHETLRVKTPLYDPERGDDIPATKLSSLQSGIKASDVPQWLWTRHECRAWMYAVLIQYLNWSPEHAIFKALQLKGFGPMLYLATKDSWIDFLGDWPGACVYAMLLGVRHSEGAIPRHILVGHGEN